MINVPALQIKIGPALAAFVADAPLNCWNAIIGLMVGFIMNAISPFFSHFAINDCQKHNQYNHKTNCHPQKQR